MRWHGTYLCLVVRILSCPRTQKPVHPEPATTSGNVVTGENKTPGAPRRGNRGPLSQNSHRRLRLDGQEKDATGPSAFYTYRTQPFHPIVVWERYFSPHIGDSERLHRQSSYVNSFDHRPTLYYINIKNRLGLVNPHAPM